MIPAHPFFEGLSPTLHISHRGGALLAPENTMAAFEQAVQRYRTDMLEIDVQLTRDGELVVAHDDDVDCCTDGTGDISTYTLEALQRLDAGHRFTRTAATAFRSVGRGCRSPRCARCWRPSRTSASTSR